MYYTIFLQLFLIWVLLQTINNPHVRCSLSYHYLHKPRQKTNITIPHLNYQMYLLRRYLNKAIRLWRLSLNRTISIDFFELSDEIAATCVLLSDEMSRNLSEICSKSIAKDVPLNSIYEACEQTSANCSLLSSQLSDQCVLVSGQSVAPNFTIYSTHQMQNTCNLLAEETNLLCNRISNEINTSMNPLHKEMLSLCTRTAENCHDAIFAMPNIYDDTGMALFCQEQKDLARVTNESSLCVSDQMLATILAI